MTAAATAAIGAVLPAASGALGWLAWPPAAYMVAIVRLAADVPLASAQVRGLGTEHAIVYYDALAAVVWFLGRRRPDPVVVPVTQRPSPIRSLIPAPGMLLLLAESTNNP